MPSANVDFISEPESGSREWTGGAAQMFTGRYCALIQFYRRRFTIDCSSGGHRTGRPARAQPRPASRPPPSPPQPPGFGYDAP
ncbi:hypothetical protein EVAR_67832_1 [Eumeta japonica]|uniref:Uncharacterized protein n=1 Tax=Eumeta variegata TaxID=151549 RepID=A0A4C1ZXI7_EUMVA|nr:hypothetical protein EVAR_67832_1 [Eumeta japonica]